MKKTTFALIALLSLSLTTISGAEKSPRVEKNLSIFNDVLRQVDMWYVDTLNYEALTETALTAMLKQIDPYTVYIPERKNETVKMFTTGKYGGIGAIIMQYDSAKVVISQPYKDLPAQRNGILAGDVILEVDGKKCKGLKTSDVSSMLRGKAGSTVKIKLQREGVEKPFVKEIVREEIKLPTVPHYAMLNDTVGYMAFSEFTEHSSKDFRHALDDLCQQQGCRHLVLDLRGNGGGLISEALNIAGYFLPKGTVVVTTKGKVESSKRTYKTVSDPLYPTLPITILVDRHSASASEILCGSLQDLHRATLIGEKTFGKGLVQNIRKVVHDGNLKVTTAKYYLPSERCIQGIGIEPDIAVKDDTTKVNITYSLYRQHLCFDYANHYHRLHDSIPALNTRLDNLEDKGFFALDSLDLADFEQFLQERNFTYETETSRYFADLLRFAHQEDLDSAMVADLEALQEKLTSDYHAALWKHKAEVLSELESEIASRYYYQIAPTIIALRRDPVLARALKEIAGTNK